MESFFNAVQFSHRLVLAASSTLFLLAFSPNPAFIYEGAQAELESLKDANLSVERYIRQAVEDLDLISRISEINCAELADPLPDQQALFDKYFQNDSTEYAVNALLFIYPSIKSSNVDDLIDFIDTGVIYEFCVSNNSLVSFFAENFRNTDLERVANINHFSDILINPTPSELQYRSSINRDIYAMSYDNLLSHGFDITESTNPLFDFEEWFLNRSSDFPRISFIFSNHHDDELELSLPMKQEYSLALGEVNGTPLFFESQDHLRSSDILGNSNRVRDEIGEKKLDDAILYLGRRIGEESSSHKIYGVEIGNRDSVLVAPILIGGLILFFFGHVVGLKHAVTRSHGGEPFPSVLFLPGRWMPISASVATVIFFPIASTITFVNRVGEFSSFQGMVALCIIGPIGRFVRRITLTRNEA